VSRIKPIESEADAHPLAAMLSEAAQGRFPPANGATDVFPSPPGKSDLVMAFTAHHVVAADIDPQEVCAQLPSGDLGAPLGPQLLSWLIDRLGSKPGPIDAVLAAPRVAEAPLDLVPAPHLLDHPRAARAALYRDAIRVYTDRKERGLVVLGRGVVGRLEVSVEIEPQWRAQGLGRALALAARTLVPVSEPLFAQVTPGNAISLRAFLAAGFKPLGSEVLFLRRSVD
jgi:GNAT superfamily N-acetyltransferase